MVDQSTLEGIAAAAGMVAMTGLIVAGHIYLLKSRIREYVALGMLHQPAATKATTKESIKAAPYKIGLGPTDDPHIRDEGSGLVELEITTIPPRELYGDEYKRVELNGSIGKGLTPEDYTALVAYLDKSADAHRIHPREEPRFGYFHERAYLVRGVAVTVPEPLRWLRVEGFPPAVDYVAEQLTADHPFLKRPKEVDVK